MKLQNSRVQNSVFTLVLITTGPLSQVRQIQKRGEYSFNPITPHQQKDSQIRDGRSGKLVSRNSRGSQISHSKVVKSYAIAPV